MLKNKRDYTNRNICICSPILEEAVLLAIAIAIILIIIGVIAVVLNLFGGSSLFDLF